MLPFLNIIVAFYPELIDSALFLFRLIEMQVVLAELLDAFELSPAAGNVEISRAFTSIMTPM